jgi:crotonobetainyl-CoA:carnitine CoA-transferase CaiB-like acyl-CoA transferase
VKPLEGLRVLDLSRVLSGPYCTMVLGDFGAEVIKVEEPRLGDETRGWLPPSIGDQAAYFLSVNRNKRSIAVDLKNPEGLKIIHDLARRADVVVENFRPGTAARLGVGYEDLSALNPRLIYLSISGFGQTGPYKHKPGYDAIAQAMGGLMNATGYPDLPPVRFGVAVADIGAVTEWMGRALIFQSNSVGQVGAEIERRYGVRIRIQDPDLDRETVTASFTGESFEEVMVVLCRLLGARCSVEARSAIIARQ